MNDREPDFEVELTQEQLTQAVGDFCADRLRRIPVGQYESTQLSLITDPKAGTVRAVFKAWAPPGVLSGPFKVQV